MKILLTNDDGINADGMNILAETLDKNGFDVTIVAPSEQQSATSRSISLYKPLKINKIEEKKYSVTGTPVDCVVLASQVVCKNNIDLVISGINAGQNMGEDVFYSGTVAAALEGLHFGFKSVAISLAAYKNQNFKAASKHFVELLKNNLIDEISTDSILNINYPNIENEKFKGIKITKLGHRHYEDFITTQKNPLGENMYWIGGSKPTIDKNPDTDLHAISENFISISPLKPNFNNLKHYNQLKKIEKYNEIY